MRRLVILISLLFLTACATKENSPVIQLLRVYITATPQPTITPTTTPFPSQTPLPTPTPTPTAKSALISGSPRGYQMLDPTPVYGAPCGLVDTFDFPLDPPDGEEASVRFEFGAYNSRYEKYHAGEDWGMRDQPNLGQPVYAIGHGEVTFAAPNGWGLDKGTIVIRHTFPWGGYVLSFYGHLDPPSVTLKAGDCVQRGDKIGEIGDPISPPHLHFEIRYHLPNSTGHGYWSTDPAKAGWLPPSQTIWETRMIASPGVLWTRGYTEGLTLGLGMFQESYILLQEGEMLALDPVDGSIQWSQPVSDTIKNAILDEAASQVYLLDIRGDLSAYPMPDPAKPGWVARLNALTSAELLPLPGGGVLVADRRRAMAVDPAGNTLWEVETLAPPTSWVQKGDILVFTTSDDDRSIWSGDADGISAWQVNISGKIAVMGEKLYLYAEDGIYKLDAAVQTATPIFSFPKANLRLGSLVPLPEGGLVFTHVDGYDRRLLALDPDGSLKWERSLMALPLGDWQLVSQGTEVYLMISHSGTTGSEVNLYAVDLESAILTLILTGGTTQSFNRNTWLDSLGTDLFLVNVGAGPMAAFDPRAAFAIISSH